MSSDEALRLRTRDSEDEADATQGIEGPADGSLTILGVTASDGAYPTVAQSCFRINILAILGNETEGATASKTTTSGKIYAFNLGATVPPVGTEVQCTEVPHRWVFRYD